MTSLRQGEPSPPGTSPGTLRITANPNNLEVLIPAAGASRRLGRPKLLCRIDGQALIQRAVRLAASIGPAAIHIVLGAVREPIEALVADLHPVRVHYNSDWSRGMAGSLITALKRVDPDCPAIVVLLPDQALLNESDLATLLAAWRQTPDRPAAAAYSGTFGAPAILPNKLFPEINALRGDRGARAVLTARISELVTVPMANAAFDLDTPADESRITGIGPTRS